MSVIGIPSCESKYVPPPPCFIYLYSVLYTHALSALFYLISCNSKPSHEYHTLALSPCAMPLRSRHSSSSNSSSSSSNSSSSVCMHIWVCNLWVWMQLWEGASEEKGSCGMKLKASTQCSSAEHPPRKKSSTSALKSDNEIMKGRQGGEHQERRHWTVRRNWR